MIHATAVTAFIGSMVVLLTQPHAARIDRYPRQPGIDAQHYVYRLELSDASDTIIGDATVELRFVRDSVREFALDLITVAEGRGFKVESVTANGATLRFTHQGDRVLVTLPAAPRATERRLFQVRYRGLPGTGFRIGPNKYNDRTFFSWNWPDKARTWIPIIDHPYDKATSEFIITAPVKYQVVANGLLQEERELGDGRRLTHWRQSQPIASWLNAVGVAQFASRHFATYRGIPLQWWVYQQDREAGAITFEEPTRRAIDFFSENIGPYPYEKLANVQFIGGGGTEHASAIFYGQNSVTTRGPATGLVAHEIAHQWWGNAVTESDWDDVWLSEGFATYFTHLYYEHYYGRDALVTRMRNDRTRILTAEAANPGRAVIHDNLADMAQVLRPSTIIYQKGGFVLHMLRDRIGNEAFWAGIREYYKQYRDRNASTDDLRRVMEETSGQELGWFFSQWLRRAQSPVVEGTWRYDATSKRVVIELRQTQPGDAYRLNLQFGVTAVPAPPPQNAAAGAARPPGVAQAPAPQLRVERLEMTQKEQRLEIAVDAEPISVTLDPDAWLMGELKFAKR